MWGPECTPHRSFWSLYLDIPTHTHFDVHTKHTHTHSSSHTSILTHMSPLLVSSVVLTDPSVKPKRALLFSVSVCVGVCLRVCVCVLLSLVKTIALE